MRKILTLSAFMAFSVPVAAFAMPIAPAIPETGLVVQAQYRNCGGPPRRVTHMDSSTGQMVTSWVPGSTFCGSDMQPPPRRAYRERHYDESYGEPEYRPRRPPPPGWERDPYSGRDMRILR